jgi:hypothetical protein
MRAGHRHEDDGHRLVRPIADGRTSLSRARDTTRLYASAESLALIRARRGDIAAIQSALGSRLQRTQAQSMALEHADEHAVPAYIAAALGPRPAARAMRDRWDRARARIEHYRDANAITDPDDALGPRPRELAVQREWLMLDREIQWVTSSATPGAASANRLTRSTRIDSRSSRWTSRHRSARARTGIETLQASDRSGALLAAPSATRALQILPSASRECLATGL